MQAYQKTTQNKSTYHIEGKAMYRPITGPEHPRKFRLTDFEKIDTRKLSVLCSGCLYPPVNTPGTIFCYRLSQPQGHSAAETIMSMQTSGIKPVILQLVAQCLNQLRRRLPSVTNWIDSE